MSKKERKRILLIGELGHDIFVDCSVKRLCPEAPVPVANPFKSCVNLGMAGNVFLNLKSIYEDKVDIDFIHQKSGPIEKTRYIDAISGYILLRVDKHDSCNRIKIEDILNTDCSSYDALVISDYNKGFLHNEDISRICDLFYSKRKPIFLDTKKIIGAFTKKVTYIKINESEYQNQCNNLAIPYYFVSEDIIVTKGSKGSSSIKSQIDVPCNRVEIMDVSGAGDTYFAAFIHHILKKASVKEAMQFANKAAGVAVSKKGVVAVKLSEIPK